MKLGTFAKAVSTRMAKTGEIAGTTKFVPAGENGVKCAKVSLTDGAAGLIEAFNAHTKSVSLPLETEEFDNGDQAQRTLRPTGPTVAAVIGERLSPKK